MDRWYIYPFEITDDHRRLAARMNIVWFPDIEWGECGLDPKRPFGNSNMPGDVAEILGWDYDADDGLSEEQYEAAKQLHFEMGYVLRAAVTDWLVSERGDDA